MRHIDNINEIIDFLGVYKEEEKKDVKKHFENGDILVIKNHKNFIYYYWE